ncbi:YbaK/EbsC family protein [Vibrio sp. T187]|uniref:aminoacyl-tRNA deacylase n=1 Tax=Vibrio TaxID=662 RepID=UPI0010C93CFD|nr:MULTISPECIES: YbaK/EbsC family protein [Vibrio]MBW3696245.1 YbaK/EbsC family protein [Vibrio sp. T187]
MTISTRLNQFLQTHDIDYKTVEHVHSNGSLSSAVASRIPLKQVAKAVVLEDHDGHNMMAVLPADKKISMSVLNAKFNAKFQLMKEEAVYNMFSDCDEGAIPPVGEAYNMMVVCDQLLDILDEVYIEAGDHQTLLKLDQEAFKKITSHAKHTRFGKEMYH